MSNGNVNGSLTAGVGSALGSPREPAYMSLADFQGLSITLTPKAKDPRINAMDIGASNRRDVISMELQPDETVDQFIGRLRGCLKALWQGERVKKPEEERMVEKVADRVVEKMAEKKK